MEVQVTGCKDCPLRNNDFEQGYDCNHPEGVFNIPAEVYRDEIPYPNDCPLKTASITITIKEQ